MTASKRSSVPAPRTASAGNDAGGHTRLEVRGLAAGYGRFLVLRDISMEAAPGLTVILGPNGAGKTTLLRVVSGVIPPRAGEIAFEGRSVAGEPAHEIVAHGIAHVHHAQLFSFLTNHAHLRHANSLVDTNRRHAPVIRTLTATSKACSYSAPPKIEPRIIGPI